MPKLPIRHRSFYIALRFVYPPRVFKLRATLWGPKTPLNTGVNELLGLAFAPLFGGTSIVLIAGLP